MELLTPVKNPLAKLCENSNPNFKNPDCLPERKFLVAKRREKERHDVFSLANAAYENLRASQQEFFVNEKNENKCHDYESESEIDENKKEMGSFENKKEIESEKKKEMGSMSIKRRREKWLEEARESLPEPGCGRVMYLVKAFEKLMTIPKSKSLDFKKDINNNNSVKNGMKWALPGMEQQPKQNELQVSSASFCPSQFSVTSESLGLDSCVLPISGNTNGSVLSKISGNGRKSRRNSSERTATFGGNWRKKTQPKAKPFNLRTECLVKPPVKETTKPIDLVLRSGARAMERAQFDQQVAEKMRLIERYKKEKETIEKLAEEEEIRRLRKNLVPKAQPMPFFDRPFIPKRSLKLPTIPREPKFHLPQCKKMKSCIS